MAKVLDCETVVCEFESKSSYNVHFWTNILGKIMNPLNFPAKYYFVSPQFLFKDEFDIK